MTDEILCKIKDRIQQEIDELKENGKKHSNEVCQNGLLIAEGLRMALRIIREVEGESMNDDIISRQAAIAEFSCCELTPDGGIDANYAIDFLKQMPSAQLAQDLSKGCTDIISRQAALNAICEDGTQLERQGQYSMTMAERKQRDVDILEALPPAQPEIIRCKDCKYNATSKKCLNPNSFFLVPADDDYCSYAERRTDG